MARISPPIPDDEDRRIAALCRLHLLDTPPEERFDRLTRIAKSYFGVPIALVSLVDSDRQWFKSKQGLTASETSRAVSFCAHAILGNDVMRVDNALEDERFADNPLVTGAPHIRFYAGMPLAAPDGSKVGTLCLVDTRARSLSDADMEVFYDLAHCVEGELTRHEVLDVANAVHAQENRLRAVLETVVDGIITIGDDAVIETFNPAAQRLFGYEPAEVIGRNVKLLMPEPYHSAHDGYVRDYLTTGDAKIIGAGREVVGLRKDGTTFPMELAVGEMLVDGRRKFTGIVRDVTERQRFEAELRAKEKRYRRFTDTCPDGMLIHVDQKIRYANPAAIAMFGATDMSELLGRDIQDLVHPDDRGHFKAGRERIARQGTVERYQLRRLRLDGSDFYTEGAGSVFEYDGEDAVLFIFNDIGDRKRAEQELLERTTQLEAANKELDAFAYSVSHDLRAPLRGIDGFSQALFEDFNESLDDTGKMYIGRIRAAAQRMGRLIDDMLTLSRVTRREMHEDRVDLGALAGEVVSVYRETEPARSITVDIAAGMEVKGDSRQLQILMENLIGNAWKFTANTEQAHVEIGKIMAAGESAIFIRDNGAGFDMAYADKLFLPFQRLHSTHEFAGTGIGLATVARIVQRHGGRVWAEGEPDKGATVFFTLAGN